jgi:peptidoglycan/LPS O-acetylase OafA/YrhL
MSKTPARRHTEIESLRGIAAILVVLFHYPTRFSSSSPPCVGFARGTGSVNR